MSIVFVSNYYNHHQAPFSKEMDRLTNHNYHFIQCSEVPEFRKKLGYKEMTDDFVIKYFEKKEECEQLIKDADVAIMGSAPKNLVRLRVKTNKLTFAYSERLDKKKNSLLRILKGIISSKLLYGFHKNVYCLCSSAFTAYDYKKRFSFINKCYKWGYFPELKNYDNIEELIASKDQGTVELLFVSRFIDWKHPELPVYVAKKLKEEGINFHLTMIGNGNMEDEIVELIKDNHLENEITHYSSMSPSDVRLHMEKSSIFLFTSDRGEGWGAVLNESMNSGCAVVASSEIGAAPFLINDGENGYLYRDCDFDDFYNKVKILCLDKTKRNMFGINAYKTILEVWNPREAAKRLLRLVDELTQNGKSDYFESGPCSNAEILKDDWY